MTSMSNSTFVAVLYWLGFVMALWATMVWRAFMRRRVWRAGSTMKIGKVSAYQMALLAEGASRVALTAVVRLLGCKALTASVAGVLIPSREFSGTLDTVEQEVMAAASKPAVFHEFLIGLTTRLKRKEIIMQLHDELVGMGYMRTRGSKEWWSSYLRNMLPFAVLMLATLGGIAVLVMTAGAWFSLATYSAWSVLVMLIVALPTRVTALGRYIVWSATQHHPDLIHARATQGEALDIKTLGQSVALYGEYALSGSDMAWIPALLKSNITSTD